MVTPFLPRFGSDRQKTYRMALVTGATSGLGRAFAMVLPQATDLVLTGRDQTVLDELGADLAHGGRHVVTVAADLATEAGREALIERTAGLPIDLLINNAGAGLLGRFLDHERTAEEAIAALNVVAPLSLTHALLPSMLERARAERRRAGLIVVASEVAFAPLPFFTSYAATKAFNLTFAESLAGELGREPVDVLAFCPGPTRTAFGTRAGFFRGSFPGAASPEAAARTALAALGRRTVIITGPSAPLLQPIASSRRIAALALARAMGVLTKRPDRTAT